MKETCIVAVSGGVASAIALERVIAGFRGHVVPVFCDTKQEDADLYRFLNDIEHYFDTTITRLADGRDIWQLFNDERFIGNTRVDICSRILKRDQMAKFLAQRYPDPSTTVLAFGMGTSEASRASRLAQRWLPYSVWCPLQQPPLLDKCQMIEHVIDKWDIEPPRLYEEGFKTNNCGGACVKGGHGAWYHLYRKRPATYAEWEEKERAFRQAVGKDVAILRDRRGGETIPMTLETLRHRIEHEGYRPTDWGDACNCMGEAA